MTYYDEVLEEIRELMKQKKYDMAGLKTDQELNMPYIPADTERELLKLKKDIAWHASESSKDHELSIDEILTLLNSDDSQAQLAAAAVLCSRNMQEYKEEIQEYLNHYSCKEAAALIVEGLSEQRVPCEFAMAKDGLEYVFDPEQVVPAAESKGYLKAENLLSEWLASRNPSMFAMAKQMLAHEVYMMLPLSYDEADAYTLALNILRSISEMIDEGQTYREIEKMS